MFSKNLTLVLLGCALALASPIPNNEKSIFQPRHDGNIALWSQDTHKKIKQMFKKTVEPFEKTYYSLVEAEKNGHKYIDQIEQLRNQYHEITVEGREQIRDIEVTVLTNAIENLQNAVKYLGVQFSGHAIEQGMQLINRNIQAGQEAVIKENKNLQEIVSQKTNSANDKIDQQQKSGRFFDEVGNAVKNAISSGVENVKEWVSSGIKFAEGITNNIGSVDQEALDSGKNTSDKKVDNIKENVNHGGTGFGSTQAVNEFGNKAQNTLENEMLKVQNQYNQYVPSANGVEQYQDNVYDSKSALGKISKQLSEAVAVHMNEVLQNLIIWRNIVENYLASGRRKFELHAQAMNEGMDCVIGNHRNLIGVVGGMNNFQRNGGQFHNIHETIGHEMLSGVSGGIKNFQGTFGISTNMAEEMGHGVVLGTADGMKTDQEKLQNIAEGLGNNIQRSVGKKSPNVAEGMSNIRGRVDNFPNFVEGVQGSFQTPNPVGDVVNIPRVIGNMPKNDKDLVPEQSSIDNGRYKVLGRKVGGHIGGHIDTFTNIVGGLLKNLFKI